MTLRPPTLTDGKVTLRAHHDDDIAFVVEQSVDPVSVRWTLVPTPYTRDDAARFVRHVMPGGWASNEEWGFAVEHEGRFCGTVSLRNRGEGRAEIAYGAHPRARGRGVMERAVRLLLDWGFSADGRNLQTVIWWAEEGNWASRRLAWRVGFSFDGRVASWLPDRDGVLNNAWVGALRRGDPMFPRNAWLEVPRIVGPQVVLRRHRAGDRERLISGANDPYTRRWIPRLPVPYTDADADAFMLLRESEMADGTAVHWVVADPLTDDFLGVLSILRIDWPEGEIGYWTHPDARGRGQTTAAVRMAIRHAFIDRADGGLELGRLRLIAAVDNAASCAIAEACGFTRVGTERLSVASRGQRHDGACYDLLADDLLPPLL